MSGFSLDLVTCICKKNKDFDLSNGFEADLVYIKSMNIRNIKPSDYSSIVNLNNLNTPAVSELNIQGLQDLHKISLRAWVIESLGQLAGFCLILTPKVKYNSENYTWVSKHYNNFEYLDRVVIAESFRGQGCGRSLYEAWIAQTEASDLLIEVNIKPMNKDSILFHEKMGFVAVGEQNTSGGEKRVQYMLYKNN